ncbi:RNA-directed RNA polymerase (Sad-1), putative [Talaromyces stipitatus ATCC 10500]|uniref:RNA-dependent RNA polymerase n=1 Tax=Talaromyces stipitatus (strain ATCC 10500 / CBS 375.48 / QM 6759 / NRRL 1006) TaxID=441959 RepID=B8MMS8_TALSN|nr:RNA-directed RNA polymerase (Sad-1), putative [Talaromyces stipitatus ATCC 10500]EED13834.1 RNA-directed RNA polymerase (Sad-1), putative [Talaromyces stipitatus ATCC 10500]
MTTLHTAEGAPTPNIFPRRLPFHAKKYPSPKNTPSSKSALTPKNYLSPNKRKNSPRGSKKASPMAIKIRDNQAHRGIKPIWQTWDSFAVNLAGVPDEANTFTIWSTFNRQGSIFSIDLYEDDTGKRNGRGRIRFRPPPQTDFWKDALWQLHLSGGRKARIRVKPVFEQKDNRIQSPVNPDEFYPAEFDIPVATLDFGPMIGPNSMLLLRHLQKTSEETCRLTVDLKNRQLLVFFQLPLQSTQRVTAISQYRLQVPFAQLTTLYQQSHSDESANTVSHIIRFDSPPLYHRHLYNVESSFSGLDSANSWRAMDCWYRQTDIVHRHGDWAGLPISLRKKNPIIDIGRWNAVRITYGQDSIHAKSYRLLCKALSDFNIEIKIDDEFSTEGPRTLPVPVVWDICDEPESLGYSTFDDLFGKPYIHLPFAIRYQLEVCISHGYISEYTAAKPEFIQRLKDMEERKALALLEHVAMDKKVYWDAMNIFDILFPRGTTRRNIPSYCCMVRTATVTPSMIYWNTPSMEITNRVLRRYSEHADRFLRVRFKDEKFEGRINSTHHDTMDEIFSRIKRTMTNGIVLGDRKYEFLAFGNSQFREHGAYFFASDAHVTASNIRAWMGEFSDIKNVAKYAARLGQCFSTTRAINTCRVELKRIPDVERGPYTFSDGVGRISRFLAQMTQQELNIRTADQEPPSAYQFRLGGCKGMLVLSDEPRGREIEIRPSQEKFPANHQGLEIIRWSQFSSATLNRQLIAVLSSLGIEDKVFHGKLQRMVSNLEEATHYDRAAMHLLQKYIDPNEMTLVISKIVSDGFLQARDPFITSVITLWKAWQIKYLKEKAKITIEDGACVLGVMDETATLKGFSYENVEKVHLSRDSKLDALPEIFLQVYRADEKKYGVVEGVCILARNPSLHPGDIRVVRAVNRSELAHLKDVVVLPQVGDRDIASMCSGGDLDGDDYLVIWDQDLIPSQWFRTPMDYTAIKGVNLNRAVTVNDITTFFVNYMKNDSLPKIAHAHMAWADYLEDGVESAKCIRLAQLHSNAVDYNKTGEPAYLPRDLRPRKWPHFMEKNYKPKDQIYHSEKILGQLYDAVDRVDFHPDFDRPFDKRVLEAGIEVTDEILQFVKELKVDYDLSLKRIMAQHEIRTEFEIWSTFVLGHANLSKDYKFHEELGGITKAIKDRFQGECYAKVGGRDFDRIAPVAVAIYRVTSDEVVTAMGEFRKKNPEAKPNPENLPMISFAWLFPDVLGRVALRYFDDSPEGDKATAAVTTMVTTQENKQEIEGPMTPESEKENTDTTDRYSSSNKDVDEEEITDESEIEEVEIIEDQAQIKPCALDILKDMLFDSEDDIY